VRLAHPPNMGIESQSYYGKCLVIFNLAHYLGSTLPKGRRMNAYVSGQDYSPGSSYHRGGGRHT
jgi:hypothetical protein